MTRPCHIVQNDPGYGCTLFEIHVTPNKGCNALVIRAVFTTSITGVLGTLADVL
jgi:hypothetical protein